MNLPRIAAVAFGVGLLGCSDVGPTPEGDVLPSPALGASAVPLVLQPGQKCDHKHLGSIVTFEDANLEAAVRAGLNLGAQDDLTCALAAGLTREDLLRLFQ